MREEVSKHKSQKESISKRWQKIEIERSTLEQQLKHTSAKSKNAEHQKMICQKQLVDKQQELEVHIREKNVLARTKENLGDYIRRMQHELMVCEYSRRKIEHELDTSLRDIMDVHSLLSAVEKERDKHSLTAQNLAQQVSFNNCDRKVK